MNLIQVQNGHKSYGSKALFEGASFAVNEGEHVGVIGPNGAGKSTLFKILIGEEEMEFGEVVRSRALHLGYLAQEVTWSAKETLEEYLSTCSLPIWDLKHLGTGLGLDEAKFNVPLLSLSGGYRMRAKLLYLIGSQPNLMLLDEPTNYLDLETLLVLERFLQDYKGAFMVISHDREFLKRTTDHTLEIEQGEITKYPGNIDDYFEQKILLREQLEKQALGIDAKRKHIMDFVTRFGAKASKARQAQSKLKSLNKLEKIEIKSLPVTARIHIPEPERIGKRAISMELVALGYGQKTVLSSVDFTLARGEKVGIVGFNGVGKSTLLKAMAGVLKPQQGQVSLGAGVRIGYYAQHVAEELNASLRIIDELRKHSHPDVKEQEILDMAGSLLFSGDAVQKPIGVLSGGEKARVALAKILLQKVPLLLMDEATNHLDFNTVEALTQALQRYQGTLAMVSHDRGFIQRVATKILEIRDGQVLQYPGTYDEYVWSISRQGLAETDERAEKPAVIHKTGERFNYKDARKQIERDIRQCDRQSEKLEQEISELQQRMAELGQKLESVSGSERDEMLMELGRLPHQIIGLETKWESVLEEKDQLEERLKSLIEN